MAVWVEDRSDSFYAAAFVVSLLLHGLLLMLHGHLPTAVQRRHTYKPVEVVYDYELVDLSVNHLRERLSRLKQGAEGLNVRARLQPVQISIPERPSIIGKELSDALNVVDPRVVDLNNLQESAGGDPVKLSYFQVINMAIQKAANRPHWSHARLPEGAVRLTFVLLSNGQVQDLAILPVEGGVQPALEEAAAAILQAAQEAFPPFPPSFPAEEQLISLVMEFI
jgi:hypothetical protein